MVQVHGEEGLGGVSVGLAIAAAGGMLGTAALGSTFAGGGMAWLPPATAVIGALFLGWTAGTVVSNSIDRTFKSGSGEAGNWWYEHVLH